jgi:hypothetical protein
MRMLKSYGVEPHITLSKIGFRLNLYEDEVIVRRIFFRNSDSAWEAGEKWLDGKHIPVKQKGA